jgi:hypothetical protein
VTELDQAAAAPAVPDIPGGAGDGDGDGHGDAPYAAAEALVLDAARRSVPARFEPPSTAGGPATPEGPGAPAPDDVGDLGDTPERHGDDLPAYDDEEAWAGRTLDGAWLAELLCTPDGDAVRARGIAIHGARIVGGLPLDGAALPFRLELVDCQLGDHPVLLRDARTRTIRLTGVRCGGVEADRAHIAGALLLHRASVRGPVHLVDARIDASVECNGARLVGPGGAALDADRAHIAGSLILRDGFAATGGILLEATSIGGSLDAVGARLQARGPDQRALSANGAQVGVSVFLNEGCTATGRVEMYGVRVGRDLIFTRGRFDNPGGDALALNGARTGGKVLLRRATVAGRVRINNSAIGGDLVCGGARLDVGTATDTSDVRDAVDVAGATGGGDDAGTPIPELAEALSASRAGIDGHVVLDEGFAARGEVRLAGATIAGTLRCSSARLEATTGDALNADSASIGEAVVLDDGFTAHGTLQMDNVNVGSAIEARGAELDGGGPGTMALDLRGARIGGTVNLVNGCTSRGEIRLTRTTVGGHVDCSGADLANPGAVALRISGARIGGGVYLERGFAADGEVRAPGVTIGRDLLATGDRLHNPGGCALRLTRAQITGDAVVGRGLTATGQVLLVRAGIGGNLDFSGGTFSHTRRPALDLPYVEVGGAVLCSKDTTVTGRVNLAGALVGGDVDLDRARIANDEAVALAAPNARVTGGFSLHGEVDGGVELRGIAVGGDLDCSGAHLVGTADRPALSADRAQVTGALWLARGFRAEGRVQLRTCEIGGHASCYDGTFSNPGGTALTLGGARIASDLGLDAGFCAEGAVRLGRVTIGSDLMCSRATFSNPGDVALRLTGAQVTGTVHLDDGFVARGKVQLLATTVGGDVRCNGGRFENPGADAIEAAGARIGGRLSVRGRFRAEGTVVLRNATVGTLQDDAAAWPDRLDLDGFRYERLSCPPDDTGWRARSRWLRRQRTPSSLGYVQLAAVYRQGGDELYARRILIDRYNALLRPPPHWVDQLPKGPLSQVWKLWRWVLRLTIGHGFAPARSLIIGLPLAVALSLWLGYAAHEDMLVATDETAVTTAEGAPRSSDCDDRYPCVQPVVYALDNLVPLVDFGQRSRWSPDLSHRGDTWFDDGRWLATATWSTSLLGWVLATLVAASFTQMIRRE